MSIKVTVKEQLQHLQRQTNAALSAQEVANIAFVTMAEQGLIPEEVAAKHAGAFPEAKEGEALANGALRRVDGELVKAVVKELPASGKQKAYTETSFEPVIAKEASAKSK